MTASNTAGLEMNYGGHSATQPAAAGSSLHMKLTDQGFPRRVDFTGQDEAGASTNQLKVNGDSYTILTQLGDAGSTTGKDLQGIRGNLSGKYALGANIDASATAGWSERAGFAPIGDGSTVFTGTFEGLGHHITGLTVNRGNQEFAGLFGDTLNATLRKVGLQGGSVTGGDHVGRLAGRSQTSTQNGATALVSNVYNTGRVTDTNAVGAVVGSNVANGGGIARIAHTFASGAVRGIDGVGGLVGRNQATGAGDALISGSRATGAVVGEQRVGGLVGQDGPTGARQASSRPTARERCKVITR